MVVGVSPELDYRTAFDLAPIGLVLSRDRRMVDLLALVLALLPTALAPAGLLVPMTHAVWAPHSVCRDRWRATLLRASGIASCYLMALAMTIYAIGIASIASG